MLRWKNLGPGWGDQYDYYLMDKDGRAIRHVRVTSGPLPLIPEVHCRKVNGHVSKSSHDPLNLSLSTTVQGNKENMPS